VTTYSWRTAASGLWSAATGWSPSGPPNATTADAVIGLAGTYVVTVQATDSFTVDSVTVSASGATLSLLGTVTLGGTLATLAVQAGTVLASGAIKGGTVAVSGGVFSAVGSLAYAGTFQETAGTVSIAGGKTLTLSGPVTLNGGDIAGPGTLSTSGTTSISGQVFVDGALNWVNSGKISNSYYLYSGANGATTVTFTNASTGVFAFTSDVYAFYEYSGSATNFTNAGLLTKTAGSGTSNVYAAVSSTGTITASSGTLELDAGGTLGGTIGATGAGALALGYGVFTLAGTTQTITGALLLDGGTLSIGTGKTLTLSGPVTLTGGDIAGPGTLSTTGTTTVNSTSYLDGGLTWTNSGTVLENYYSYVGSGGTTTAAFVNTSTGTFDFTSDVYAFYEYSGSAANFTNAGLLTKTGGTGTSHIYAPVTDTGTIGATTGTLEFDGGGTFSGRVTGPGVVALTGAAAFGTLTLAGGASLSSAGTIDQAGAASIGDTSTSGATLTNAAGALYRIDNDTGITRGTATASSLVNLGTLSKTGGTATSTISVGIVNSGLISVGTATLSLKGAVSGTGAMVIGNGAALDLGTAVAGGQTISFGGLTGTLFVDSLTFMAGTINGFGVGETLDVTGATITKVSVNAADQLVMMNGATTLGQFQLTGNHSGDTFSLVADGKGGTKVLITKSVTSWNGTTGDWLTPSGWSAGVPAIGFDANVALGGTYTLSLGYGETGSVRTLTVSGPAATVDINGTLTVASALSVTAGTLALAGTIVGGTMSAASGAVQYDSGTLSNVAYWGTLDLSANYSYLIDAGGLTLAGASGTGPGTVQLTGYGSSLYVAASDTLNNATINIGDTNTDSTLYLYNSGVTLTLGSGLTLQHVGTYAQIYLPNSGDAIINKGTIAAGLSGGQFTVSSGAFTNQGTISVTNCDSFDTTSTTFSNTGNVTVNGGTLSLGSWANTGTISLSAGVLNLGTSSSGAWTGVGTIKATGGTLGLGGSLTAAQLAAISVANTSVGVTGTLTNTGGKLIVGAGTSLGVVALSGTIAGGVIVDAGGGGLVASSGTLSNVAYWGTLDLSANYSYLTDAGGLTLAGAAGTGPGTVQLTGYGSYLYVAAADTLNNATINIGNTSAESTLYLYNSGVTLTLGSGLTLQHVGAYAQIYLPYSGDAIINKGTISAGLSGGQFTVSYGTFTNQGTISVSNGDSLDLSSTTLTNLSGTVLTGGVFSVAAGSTLQLASNTTLSTDAASITLDGVGSVIQSNDSGTQTGIDSTLTTIASGGTLALLDGRSFTATANSGSLTDSGLLLLGNATFGATTLTVSGGTIAGSGTISAAVAVSGGATASGGPLTLSGTLSGTGTLAIVAGATISLVAGGKLTGGVTDSGTLVLAGSTLAATSLTVAAGGVLTGYGAMVGTLTDGGLIDATGGTLSVAGLTKLSAGIWSGAAIEADAASTLQLANNATIGTDAGIIVLSGAGSVIRSYNSTTITQVSLDSTLATVATGGTLALLNGRAFTAVASAGTFTDNGTILLAGGSFSATRLAMNAGAVISGSGALTAPITVTGAASLTGGTLTLAGSVSGTGTMTVTAETLLLAGASLGAVTAVTATGSISGFGTLSGALTNLGWIDATGGTLSAAGLTGLASGTLSAGQIEADAASLLQLAPNLAITTIAGGVTLSGTGSVIESLNTTTAKQVLLDSTLVTIAAGGTLSLLNGRALTMSANGGTLTDSGLLSLNGGTLNAARVVVTATGTFLDNGGFVGAISNAGTVSIADGATLALTSGGTLGGTYAGNGTLQLNGTIAYLVGAGATLAAGQVTVSTGSTLSGTGTILAPLDVLGTVVASGGTLILDGSLTDAGTLTAAAGAVLDLADGGAFFGTVNGAGSVINADAILGGTAGLSLTNTGTISLTNRIGGEISGGQTDGADLTGASLVVANAGAIGGVRHGLWLTGAASVTNSGLISGDIGTAILASGPGAVTIVNTGLIVNYEGVGAAALSLSGAASATVTNAGTIIGGYYLSKGGSAIQFGPGNDRLIVDPGAVFIGTVRGGGGTNTLEFAASPTVGTVGTFSGLGTQFQSFTSLTEDAAAAWALGGTNTLSATTTLTLGAGAGMTVAGTLIAVGGSSVAGTGTLTIAATGLLDASGGGTVTIGAALASGTLTGGTIEVDAATTLQLGTAVTTDNASLVLSGAGGTIQGRNASGTQLTLAQSLATIGAAGTLSLINGAGFTTAGTLGDQGLIGLTGAGLGTGTLSVGATGTVIGTGTVGGTIADAGLIEASGGTLTLSGTVSGAGTIGIDADSVLYAAGTLGAANIAFLDSGGGLTLARPVTATGTIAGFSTSDSIDLVGSVVTSEAFAANVLTLKGAAGTLASLHFAGDYTGYGFAFTADGHGGSDIYLV
jgi:hypothetical protein